MRFCAFRFFFLRRAVKWIFIFFRSAALSADPPLAWAIAEADCLHGRIRARRKFFLFKAMSNG
jgi:hypothetical protein